LSCNIVEDAVELSFALGRGAFATSVLRELANTNATGGTRA